MGKCFIVIGPNCWGKGSTKREAKRNAKREAPSWAKRPGTKCVVYEAPDSAYVDEMGAICAPITKLHECVRLGEEKL